MTPQEQSVARRPSIFLLLLWLLLIGLLVWIRVADPTGDEGTVNAISQLLAIPLIVTMWLWIVLRSSLPRRTRGSIAWGCMLALAAFFALMRHDGYTGAMIPQFVPRFSSAGPDLPREMSAIEAELESSEGRPGTIDLTRVAATDFPGFLGADRLGRLSGVHLARDWSTRTPELLWKQECGLGWSGFAVVNGVAVTQEERMGQQVVIAYRVSDGELLWSHRYGQAFEHSLGGPGPRATPTIADGAVVILGAHGQLLCLEGASGALRWKRDLLSEYGVDEEHETEHVAYGRANSPLVVDGRVIIPVGGVAGARQAGLAAFDLRDGELLWEGPPRHVSFASPSLATLAGVPQILIMNESSASAHDPGDGSLLWEHPWPGTTSTGSNCSQVMPVDGERVLLTKGYDGGAALLKLSRAADGEFSVEKLWHNKRCLRTKFTNAFPRGSHIYGLSDGILECADLETGKRVWKGGRYGHGQMLLVDDLLLILTEIGELVLVEATPDEAARELGRFEAIDGKTWNNIALAGDLAVVRNGQEAAVVRLPLQTR